MKKKHIIIAVLLVLASAICLSACQTKANNNKKIETNEVEKDLSDVKVYLYDRDLETKTEIVETKKTEPFEYSVAMSSLIGIPLKVESNNENIVVNVKSENADIVDLNFGEFENIEDKNALEYEKIFYCPKPENLENLNSDTIILMITEKNDKDNSYIEKTISVTIKDNLEYSFILDKTK
ncbi:MAG: hypothetical protein Q4P29_05385 [Tissierellia bacterium]|nr:hypothetical protein [Tissierellia bacterium]